jgi:hypothetical protein
MAKRGGGMGGRLGKIYPYLCRMCPAEKNRDCMDS